MFIVEKILFPTIKKLEYDLLGFFIFKIIIFGKKRKKWKNYESI